MWHIPQRPIKTNKMKTLLLLLLIPLSASNTLLAQAETILIEVEFGVKSKNLCKTGYGICSITPIKKSPGKALKGYRAVATAKVIDGVIVSLNFHANTMHQGTLKMYFSEKTFNFDSMTEIRVPTEGFLLEVSGLKYNLSKTKLGFLLEVSG